MSVLTPRMLLAWRATGFTAGDAVARIGRRSPSVDALLRRLGVRVGAFVGAGNPMARRHPEGWNAQRQVALTAWARRLPCCTGEGVGRGWREPHLLLGCDQRRAAVLARRFRQAGMVQVRSGAPASLVLLHAGMPRSPTLEVAGTGGAHAGVLDGLAREIGRGHRRFCLTEDAAHIAVLRSMQGSRRASRAGGGFAARMGHCMTGIRSTVRMAKADSSTARPRGTKPVSQAFFTALDSVPAAQQSAVGKAALAMIRDEIRNRRDKQKAMAAKAKASGKTTAAKATRAPRKSPVATPEPVETPAPAPRRGRRKPEPASVD